MMNRVKLKEMLEKEKIPPHLYNVDGQGRNDERLCLEKQDNGWNVYFSERGIKTTDLFFESENEACQYIFDRLYGRSIKMNIDYLPIGSVVLLRGGVRKLVIIARGISVPNGDQQFFFDYGGVAYPEGLVKNQMAYFNHDSISNVIFEGFSDPEDKNMVQNINDYLKEHPETVKGSPDSWK